MSKKTTREIARLREEIQNLRDSIRYLVHSKLTNERYAFFDWIVQWEVFGERRTRLSLVLSVLGDRLDGTPLSKKREIPGVSSELLYREAPPTYEEATQLLMEALQTRNEITVAELFDALKNQGIHRELAALKRGDS